MIDLGTPDAIADPHALFRSLRSQGPVLHSEKHRAWLVLSHAGVTAGFREPRLSADRVPAFERMAESRPPGFKAVVDLLRGWMVFRDDPAHDRLRDPVRRAFTPRRIEEMATSIERTTDELLDGIGDGTTVDLRSAFAAPLPALVIADLLDIPRGDRREFQHWSDLLSHVVFAVDAASSSAEDAIAGAELFWSYFGDLVASRRRNPGDDLISELALAIDDDEVIGACTLLLFAGHETTTGLLTNGTRLLLDDGGDAIRQLHEDPSRWTTAVDELLRMEGPAKLMVRRAKEDVVLDGVSVPGGSTVWLVILAADRDPMVFTDPDRLDIERDPNPHLAFGWGIHHCLGAPLARLESRIAMRRLFERFDLATTRAARWGGGVIGRGIGSLEAVATRHRG